MTAWIRRSLWYHFIIVKCCYFVLLKSGIHCWTRDLVTDGSLSQTWDYQINFSISLHQDFGSLKRSSRLSFYDMCSPVHPLLLLAAAAAGWRFRCAHQYMVYMDHTIRYSCMMERRFRVSNKWLSSDLTTMTENAKSTTNQSTKQTSCWLWDLLAVNYLSHINRSIEVVGEESCGLEGVLSRRQLKMYLRLQW